MTFNSISCFLVARWADSGISWAKRKVSALYFVGNKIFFWVTLSLSYNLQFMLLIFLKDNRPIFTLSWCVLYFVEAFLNDASASCLEANRLYGSSVVFVTSGNMEVFWFGASPVVFSFYHLAEALVGTSEKD